MVELLGSDQINTNLLVNANEAGSEKTLVLDGTQLNFYYGDRMNQHQ
jgi:hypothetical protein